MASLQRPSRRQQRMKPRLTVACVAFVSLLFTTCSSQSAAVAQQTVKRWQAVVTKQEKLVYDNAWVACVPDNPNSPATGPQSCRKALAAGHERLVPLVKTLDADKAQLQKAEDELKKAES
jgi:hypothetical protein